MAPPLLQVRLPEKHKHPRAVVLLFGWFGAQMRHVQKYADLYNERDCATITGTVDNYTVMFKDDANLDDFCWRSIHEAAKIIHTHEKDNNNIKIPLLVHVFSNGGGFVLERFEKLLQSTHSSSSSTSTTPPHPDLVLVAQRLKMGGEIFDSAPAYMHMSSGLAAVQSAIPSPVWMTFLSQLLLVLIHYYERFVTFITRRDMAARVYWSQMMYQPGVTTRQAYVYSTADTITDPIKLEELIAYRQQKLGVNVLVKKFHDSAHVQHLRAHKDEYCQLIDDMLALVEGEK